MAVRLSLGAGRFRVVRQLLTESVLLASLSGALGILIAVAGIRVLTLLLANGQEGFTLHAELNWHVLAVTLGLSLLCGVLFGLAPALQSTRPARDAGAQGPVRHRAARARCAAAFPRLSLTQALVVAQIAISLLLLVAAGLFVRTLSNLQSHSARVQSRERAAVRAECAAGRVPGDQGRRLLRRSAAPPQRDSRRARRDAVACVADPGRPGASDHGRRRAGAARHAHPVDRARLLHDHADSAAARPGDRRARSARARCPSPW